MAEIPSAFKPYVVDIGGLSASKEVAWTGKASMHWWGEIKNLFDKIKVVK